MGNLESDVQAILERNERVEKDKAWEGSFARRGFIILMIYVFSYLFMRFNHLQNSEIQALIPSGAYLLSTLSLSKLKEQWTRGRSQSRRTD